MPHMRLKHNRNLKSFLALLVLALPAAQAEIAIHNVSGYTLTASGSHQFSVLIVSHDGKL